MSSEENGKKSRNGNNLQYKFENDTGWKKALKKDKPIYTNSQGRKQIIDFDYYKEIDGIKYFLDLTTSYRSDRAKQKAYNGLILKMFGMKNYRYYMVVGTMMNGNRKQRHYSLEGLDGVFLYTSIINRIKKINMKIGKNN